MPKTAKKRLKSRWTSEPILTKIKKSVESRLCGNLLWRGWPTFLEKKVEKQGKWGIMKIENAVNTVVEPYLWVIETDRRQQLRCRSCQCWTVPMSDWNSNSIPVCIWNSEKLNRTYEWLKPDWDPSGRRPSFRVEPYLWVICCFCWTHCFIRILWIVSLIFKENTNKKMLQLIKSWSFFVKKFWLQEVGMYLQWRRCCPREIREMLLIISVWKRMGVALMVCRFLSWRINGRLIMSR